jgi:hypothetical protein
MVNDRKDAKAFASLLKTLLMAKTIHSRVESTLNSVALQIALGIPPSISVELT